MADSKRGRSTDDEFDDNDELAEFEDADEVDEDMMESEDDEPADKPARRSKGTAVAARSKARVKEKDPDEVRVGIFGRLIRFVREVAAELQKVIWPTRKELLTYTSVVVVFVAVVMALVAGLDVGFAKLMFLVFGSKTTT